VVSTASAQNTGSGTLTVTLGTHTAAGVIAGTGLQTATVTFREFARNFAVEVVTGSGKTVDRDMTTDGIQVDEGDTVYFSVSFAPAMRSSPAQMPP